MQVNPSLSLPLFLCQLLCIVQAIGILKLNPTALHKPELSFFRDYLTSLGATIPSVEELEEQGRKNQEGAGSSKPGVCVWLFVNIILDVCCLMYFSLYPL